MRLSAPMAMAQLRAVFERHADRHMTIPIPAPTGVVAWWRAGRIEVQVAAAPGPVVLSSGTARAEGRPDGQGLVSLSLRAAPGGKALDLTGTSDPVPVRLLPPAPQAVNKARRAHIRRFAATLGKALPAGLRWVSARHDPARVAALRDALGLAHVAVAAALDPARLEPELAAFVPPFPEPPVVVVLAIYNAFDLLPEVLDRLEAHTDVPFELVVIEDASPDSRVRPWLRDRLAGFTAGSVTLIENEANLGFVGSANLGLAEANRRKAHVILLNSDVFVPPGWASRLLQPLRSAPDSIASVTPLSGASGLTTVPAIGPGAVLPPGLADRMDVLAQAMAGARTVALPSGMGFCMAMSARFLALVPQFDTAFGAGYGEETDWCRRTAALSGQHLAHLGLFVDHRGSMSFGTETRNRRAIAASGLIRARYPDFEAEVARFVEADPILTERMALGIALLAGASQRQELTVYLAHSLAGGAEADLCARLAAHRQSGSGALVVRVGGVLRWGLDLHGPGDTVLSAMTDDIDLLRRLLQPVARRRLVYSCGVGDRDPLALPDLLTSLLTGAEDRLEVLLHDHFPLSPSYTLLGADDWFHGLPADTSADRAHQARRPDGTPVSLRQWRAAWGRLLARADRIEAFSPSSAAFLRAAWPQEAFSADLCPHRLAPLSGPLPAKGGRVLAVLGNIRRHKGARVLQAMARMRPELKIILVGSLDPSIRAPSNLRVLGPYRRDEITTIAREHQIGAWLIPSIWPETFCFSLHEALATGLPTFGFDLGAQGDALRAAAAQGQDGFPVPPGASPDEAAAAMIAALHGAGLAVRGL